MGYWTFCIWVSDFRFDFSFGSVARIFSQNQTTQWMICQIMLGVHSVQCQKPNKAKFVCMWYVQFVCTTKWQNYKVFLCLKCKRACQFVFWVRSVWIPFSISSLDVSNHQMWTLLNIDILMKIQKQIFLFICSDIDRWERANFGKSSDTKNLLFENQWHIRMSWLDQWLCRMSYYEQEVIRDLFIQHSVLWKREDD